VGKVNDTHKEFKLENIINYFTLGFPTAASKISSYVSLREGLRTTAYSHERIIIVESMGMNSGWLALSSGMGFPDFIIIPEFPLNYDLFLEKVREKYNSQKHLIIVIAEGAKWMNGSFIHTEKDESEDFGHPRFGGSSATLKDRLKKDLGQYFNTRNINAVNPSYLYRSGRPNELDLFWAQRLGETAVKSLAEGINGAKFMVINKDKSRFKIQDIQIANFNSMDEFIRFADERFYDQKEFQITDNGRKYFREIIPEIPDEELYELESLGPKLATKITN
jgi:6-phosphofructokinase 1